MQAIKTVTVAAGAQWTPAPVASASHKPNLAPFRIHYNNEQGINNRDPIRPPDCPIPVIYTDREFADGPSFARCDPT